MVGHRQIVVCKVLACQVANRNTFLLCGGVAVNNLFKKPQQRLILEQTVKLLFQYGMVNALKIFADIEF